MVVAAGASWRRSGACRIMSSDKTYGRAPRRSRRASSRIESDNPDLGAAQEEIDVDYKGDAGADRLQRPLLHRAARARSRPPRCASSWRASSTRRGAPGRRQRLRRRRHADAALSIRARQLPCVIRELAQPRRWRNLEPLTLVPASGCTVSTATTGRARRTSSRRRTTWRRCARSAPTHADDLIRGGRPTGGRGCGREVVHRGLERRLEIELRTGGAGGAARRQAGARRGGRASGARQRGAVRARGPAAAAGGAGRAPAVPRPARSSTSSAAIYGEASAFQKVLRSRNALLQAAAPADAAPCSRPTTRSWRARGAGRDAPAGAGRGARRRAWRAVPRAAQRSRRSTLRVPQRRRRSTRPPTRPAVRGGAAARAGARRGARRATALHRLRAAHRRSRDRPRRARPRATHASQGQLRSLVLALKLAELANVEARLATRRCCCSTTSRASSIRARARLPVRGHRRARLPDRSSRSPTRDSIRRVGRDFDGASSRAASIAPALASTDRVIELCLYSLRKRAR